jgi:hypothetical protein
MRYRDSVGLIPNPHIRNKRDYAGGLERKMVLVLTIHQEWWTTYKIYINHLSQYNGVREYLPMVGFLPLGGAVCGPLRTLIVGLGYLVQF